MKNIIISTIIFFLLLTTKIPVLGQSPIDGIWQNGNQTFFFQNGQYQEAINQQVLANGTFGIGNGYVRFINSYGRITDIPAKVDHSNLYMFNNNHWQTFHKINLYQPTPQNYNTTGNYGIPSGVQETMDFVNGIVKSAYETAFDPNVKIDPSMIPAEHRKYMEISNEVLELHNLFKRMDQGDPKAKQEFEAYSKYLDQMSIMLGGMVASAKVENSVKRQQLSLQFRNQAFELREMGEYYRRNGDLQKAGHFFSKGDEFLNASKKLQH